MKNNLQSLRKQPHFLLLILFRFLAMTGCARDAESVHTETVHHPAGATSTSHVEKKTVIHEDEGSNSVIGAVFDVVGEIIALPFRLVAGIFQFVF